MPVHLDPSNGGNVWAILLAGQKIPEIDSQAAYALASSWVEAARQLQGLDGQLNGLGGHVENAVGGATGRAFRAYVGKFDGVIPKLTTAAQAQSQSLHQLALQVEHTEYSIVIELSFFAQAIAWSMASPFTAPLLPSIITAGRMAMTRLLQRLHWAARILAEALQEAVQEVLQDALAQLIQFIERNREQWDAMNTLLSAIGGAVAGGLIGGAHQVIGKLNPKLSENPFVHGGVEGGAEGIVGVGMGLALGQSLGDVWTGVVGGAFTGTTQTFIDNQFGGDDLAGIDVEGPDTSGMEVEDVGGPETGTGVPEEGPNTGTVLVEQPPEISDEAFGDSVGEQPQEPSTGAPEGPVDAPPVDGAADEVTGGQPEDQPGAPQPGDEPPAQTGDHSADAPIAGTGVGNDPTRELGQVIGTGAGAAVGTVGAAALVAGFLGGQTRLDTPPPGAQGTTPQPGAAPSQDGTPPTTTQRPHDPAAVGTGGAPGPQDLTAPLAPPGASDQVLQGPGTPLPPVTGPSEDVLPPLGADQRDPQVGPAGAQQATSDEAATGPALRTTPFPQGDHTGVPENGATTPPADQGAQVPPGQGDPTGTTGSPQRQDGYTARPAADGTSSPLPVEQTPIATAQPAAHTPPQQGGTTPAATQGPKWTAELVRQDALESRYLLDAFDPPARDAFLDRATVIVSAIPVDDPAVNDSLVTVVAAHLAEGRGDQAGGEFAHAVARDLGILPPADPTGRGGTADHPGAETTASPVPPTQAAPLPLPHSAPPAPNPASTGPTQPAVVQGPPSHATTPASTAGERTPPPAPGRHRWTESALRLDAAESVRELGAYDAAVVEDAIKGAVEVVSAIPGLEQAVEDDLTAVVALHLVQEHGGQAAADFARSLVHDLRGASRVEPVEAPVAVDLSDAEDVGPTVRSESPVGPDVASGESVLAPSEEGARSEPVVAGAGTGDSSPAPLSSASNSAGWGPSQAGRAPATDGGGPRWTKTALRLDAAESSRTLAGVDPAIRKSVTDRAARIVSTIPGLDTTARDDLVEVVAVHLAEGHDDGHGLAHAQVIARDLRIDPSGQSDERSDLADDSGRQPQAQTPTLDSGTPESPARADDAVIGARLEKLTPSQHRKLMNTAATIVSEHHHAPLVIGTPTPDEARRRQLLDEITTVVAHALHTGTEEAARELSRTLATRFGTRRRTGLPGGSRPAALPHTAAGPSHVEPDESGEKDAGFPSAPVDGPQAGAHAVPLPDAPAAPAEDTAGYETASEGSGDYETASEGGRTAGDTASRSEDPAPAEEIPAEDDGQESPRTLSADSLPDYLRSGQALGVASAAASANGRERVLAALGVMLPKPDGVRPEGVEKVERALEEEFESLLGTGRTFQVRVGNRWYEARVTATPQFPAGEIPIFRPDGAALLDLRVNTVVSSGTVTDSASAGDLAIAAMASQGVGAYAMAIGRTPRAHPHTYTNTGDSVTDQTMIRSGPSGRITVPVRYTVVLKDDLGRGKGSAEVSGDGVDVTLGIPDDLTRAIDSGTRSGPVTPEDPGWGAKLEHPFPEAVTDLDTDTSFADVAARLHPSVTAIGAAGRTTLREFLSPTGIRDQLVPMLNGWVTSPDLVSAHGAHSAVVRMKAVLRDAELVGTDEAWRLRNRGQLVSGSGVSASIAGGFDARLAVGGGVGLPTPVLIGVGVTGGYSARTAERSSAGSGTMLRSGLEIKRDVGLYKITTDVLVRASTGPDTTIPVTTYLRVGMGEAADLGLPTTTSAGLVKEGTAGTRSALAHLTDGLAAGTLRVGAFTPADDVQPQVEAALKKLPGFERFLPDWNLDGVRPGKVRGNAADVAEQLGNLRELTTKLSPTALRGSMEELLGNGVRVRLTRRGWFSDQHVSVVVKAKLGPGTHRGEVEKHHIRHYTAASPRLGSSTTTAKMWNIGLEGRVGGLWRSVANVVGLFQSAVRLHFGTTTRAAGGPVVEASSLDIGSPGAHLFEHDVEFDVEITSYSRPRSWWRWLAPGTPFRELPEPLVVARTVDLARSLDPAERDDPDVLPLIRGPVRLWMGEGATVEADPERFRPGKPSTVPLSPAGGVASLLNPGSARPHHEWVHVEAVAHTEALGEAVVEALTRASGGDASLTAPGSEARHQLDRLLSPTALKTTMHQWVHTGVMAGELRYNRGVTDRVGAVGMVMDLSNPRRVSVADTTSSENSATGGSYAVGGRSVVRALDWIVNLGGTARRNAASPKGLGGLNVLLRWMPRLRSKSDTRVLVGLVDRNRVTDENSRTVLVQMDALVSVVAESRKENTLHAAAIGMAGVAVALPGAVFVRVDEATAIRMGVLPDVGSALEPILEADESVQRESAEEESVQREPAPRTPETLHPPRLLVPGRPATLATGLLEPGRDADLSAAVWNLVDQVRGNADTSSGHGLLPDSVLDDLMNNLRRLADFTTPTSTKALIDGALDGGVPLLLHKPGKGVGKDVYQVTLKASLVDEPRFDGVVNDGANIEHAIVGLRRHVDGTARASGWNAILRAPGAHATDPQGGDPANTVGVMPTAGTARTQVVNWSAGTTDTVLVVRGMSGPMALYELPIRFELVVQKGNEDIARVIGDPVELRLRRQADVLTTVPRPEEPYRAEAHLRSAEEARLGNVAAWRAGATPIPKAATVEEEVGVLDLRGAAVAALRQAARSTDGGLGSAGALLSALRSHELAGLTGKGTGALNTLLSALSPEQVQAALPGMARGGVLEVPDLHESSVGWADRASLKVHAKLVNPRLGSLSDGAFDYDLSVGTTSDDTTSVRVQARELSGGLGAGTFNHVERHADGSLDGPNSVNFVTNGMDARHVSEAVDVVTGGKENFRHADRLVIDRTGVVAFDVEYRVVADLGEGRVGVYDLAVPGSVGLRMPVADAEAVLGKPVDGDLAAAQDAVDGAAKAWREAEVEVEKARHHVQDLVMAVERTDALTAAEAEVERGRAEVAVRAEAERLVEVTSPEEVVAARAAVADLVAREYTEGQRYTAIQQQVRATQEVLGQAEDEVLRAVHDQELANLQADLRRQQAVVGGLNAELNAARERFTEAAESRSRAEDARQASTAAQVRLAAAEAAAAAARRELDAHQDGRAPHGRVAAAKSALRTAQVAAGTAKRKWWRAKAAVDREIAGYNTRPPLTLDDVRHVPLTDSAGRGVGVAFLTGTEAEVAADVMRDRGAGRFSVAVHHGDDGFRVPLRSGGEAVLKEAAFLRLLLASDVVPQDRKLTLLACEVRDVEALRGWGRELGHRGGIEAFPTKVRLSRTGGLEVLPPGAEPAPSDDAVVLGSTDPREYTVTDMTFRDRYFPTVPLAEDGRTLDFSSLRMFDCPAIAFPSDWRNWFHLRQIGARLQLSLSGVGVSRRAKPIFVFVPVRGDDFLVRGALDDGTRLAAEVAATATYRDHFDGRVFLMQDGDGSPDDYERRATVFAAALRGEGASVAVVTNTKPFPRSTFDLSQVNPVVSAERDGRFEIWGPTPHLPRYEAGPPPLYVPVESLDDLQHVPLIGAQGESVGMAFLTGHEADVAVDVLGRTPLGPGRFAVAVHHGEAGFRVPRSGGEVVLGDQAFLRLLLTMGVVPRDEQIVLLACEVRDVEALRGWGRELGHRGGIEAFPTKVRLSRTGGVEVLPPGVEPAPSDDAVVLGPTDPHEEDSEVGSVIFFPGGRRALTRLQRVHEKLRVQSSAPRVFVYVTVRDGSFLVRGEPADGARLADEVAWSATYRNAPADAEVILIQDGDASFRGSTIRADAFAEALGGVPHRVVTTNTAQLPSLIGPRGFDLDRLKLVDASRTRLAVPVPQLLRNAGIGDLGVSFLVEDDRTVLMTRFGAIATDQTLRLAKIVGTNGKVVYLSTPWRAATRGDRARPFLVFLNSGRRGFVVRTSHDQHLPLSPRLMAEVLVADPDFRALAGGPTRRPMVLVIVGDGDPALVRELSRELARLDGLRLRYRYSGPMPVRAEHPFLELRSSDELRDPELELEEGIGFVKQGSVYFVPQQEFPGFRYRDVAAALAGGADVRGSWRPSSRPVVVALPTAEQHGVVFAGDRRPVEVDGVTLAHLMLEDERFRKDLKSQIRPVVLVGEHAGALDGPGGFAFAFAATLREKGFSNPVYAPTGGLLVTSGSISVESGGWFRQMSEPVARVSPLTGPDGRVRGVLVREPNDEQRYRDLLRWATEPRSLMNFRTLDGYEVDSPWTAGRTPLPVFTGPVYDSSGYAVSLAVRLRNDGKFRAAAGIDPDVPLLLASLDSGPDVRDLDVESFARALVPGGYHRRVHHVLGGLRIRPDGELVLGGEGFRTVEPRELTAADVVIHPHLGVTDGRPVGQFLSVNGGQDALVSFRRRRELVYEATDYVRLVRDGENRLLRTETIRLPWADQPAPPWIVETSLDSRGALVRMATSVPDMAGDIVRLDGRTLTRFVLDSETYRESGHDLAAGLVLVPDPAVVVNAPLPDTTVIGFAVDVRAEVEERTGTGTRVWTMTGIRQLNRNLRLATVTNGRFVEVPLLHRPPEPLPPAYESSLVDVPGGGALPPAYESSLVDVPGGGALPPAYESSLADVLAAPVHPAAAGLLMEHTEHVPLTDTAGQLFGVAFLTGREAEVAVSALRRLPVETGRFVVAVHHGRRGFRVPLRSGGEVRLDNRAFMRLLLVSGVAPSRANVMLLTCDVQDTQEIVSLVREFRHRGRFTMPVGWTQLSRSGVRYLQSAPSSPQSPDVVVLSDDDPVVPSEDHRIVPVDDGAVMPASGGGAVPLEVGSVASGSSGVERFVPVEDHLGRAVGVVVSGGSWPGEGVGSRLVQPVLLTDRVGGGMAVTTRSGDRVVLEGNDLLRVLRGVGGLDAEDERRIREAEAAARGRSDRIVDVSDEDESTPRHERAGSPPVHQVVAAPSDGEPVDDGAVVAAGAGVVEFDGDLPGIAFPAGAGHEARLRALRESLVVPPDERIVLVQVPVRDGAFLVRGVADDGTRLAAEVAASSAYRHADPEAAVVLVQDWEGEPDDGRARGELFAQVLRGDGPYREVTVTTEPLETAEPVDLTEVPSETVSRLRMADVVVQPLATVGGGGFAVSFIPGETRAMILDTFARGFTDHSLRSLQVVDEDGWTRDVPAAWAAATRGDRARPFLVFVRAWRDHRYLVAGPRGVPQELSPEELAELIVGHRHFQALAGGPVRRPMVLIIVGAPVRFRDAALRAALTRLDGPRRRFIYGGPLPLDWDSHVLQGQDVESLLVPQPLPLVQLAHTAVGGVFAFSVPEGMDAGGHAEVVAALRSVARVVGPWGSREPVVVALPTTERYGVVFGLDDRAVELDGDEAARDLLADGGFRAALRSRSGPVVLVGSDSGSWRGIGGFGFDFAEVLRSEGDFRDVYAVDGDVVVGPEGVAAAPGARFELVSTLRSGDLNVSPLHDALGRVRGFLVRSEGDEEVYQNLLVWATRTTPEALSTFVRVEDGAELSTPWADGAPPVPVFVRGTTDGHPALRVDGERMTLSAAELAEALRDDPGFRTGAGTDPDVPLLLASVDPGGVDAVAFAEALAPGGYHRRVHHPEGVLRFTPEGRLRLEGKGFGTVEPRALRPGDVVTHPHLVPGTDRPNGQFFPVHGLSSFSVHGLSAVELAARRAREIGEGTTRYIRVTPEPGGPQEELDLPWAGREAWLVDVTGDQGGMLVGLATGDPDLIGDVVRVDGRVFANLVLDGDVHRESGHDIAGGLALRHGFFAASPDDILFGPADHVRAELEARRGGLVPVWAADSAVHLIPGSGRLALAGGTYVEVLPSYGLAGPPPPPYERGGTTRVRGGRNSTGRAGPAGQRHRP
ncbi:hypothetical protein [Saccharothrix longispora]|uniref:WXG100-like domain-containing protein n=1 Tax=Saccharothrix longispora TaxID=33920 RepID=UPI0031E58D31